MHRQALSVLRAPGSAAPLVLTAAQPTTAGNVLTGTLRCPTSGRTYAIQNGAPALFDEADVSPFLLRDYEQFRSCFAISRAPLPPEGAERHYEAAARNGALYESWYTIAEYETAFGLAGLYPHLFVDQVDLAVSVTGYDRSGHKRALISRDQQIDDSRYGDFEPALWATRPALPAWISPVHRGRWLKRVTRSFRRNSPPSH
jgi:uncharacterized protein YbaR (Trm112 family)